MTTKQFIKVRNRACKILAKSKWWEKLEPFEVALVQLLCQFMITDSVSTFHKSVEEVLRRDVMVHEFAKWPLVLREVVVAVEGNGSNWLPLSAIPKRSDAEYWAMCRAKELRDQGIPALIVPIKTGKDTWTVIVKHSDGTVEKHSERGEK